MNIINNIFKNIVFLSHVIFLNHQSLVCVFGFMYKTTYCFIYMKTKSG